VVRLTLQLEPTLTMTAGRDLTSEIAWDAVLKKDRHYDGKFVYAAVTTGIYCRPSCPARNPQRRNTLIFATTAEAERQGYVPCLRCHPASLTPAEKSIKATLDYIERHLDQTITLNTLSQVSGFSPHHLQESFKKIVDLSPREFCDMRRLARFKQCLRAGQTISAACYEVGYGSSRALYEKTKRGLGMTPAEYKRGAKGVQIRYSTIESGLGCVLIGATQRGVCAVVLGDSEENLIRELHEEFPSAILKQQESPPDWKDAVQLCLAEDHLLSKLALSLRGRIFQARVWNHFQHA
jgi:AraC family transcriptional regulator, regulatory protein of adaptative response / methylated-DNA-[protein]-cysteine methyltransferase